MEFVKMQGLGNDFIIVPSAFEASVEDIAAWCARRTGIGADGVLEVVPVDSSTVRMRYWNADGSASEMCGNGLRCIAKLAFDRGWVDDRDFIVQTPVGPRAVTVRADGSVKALLGRPHAHRVGTLSIAGAKVHPVGVGNPHAVMYVDEPSEAPVAELGARIGTDHLFPDGSNVEFMKVIDEDRIEVRVWERGVGETLACGSGAAAAAFIANRDGHTKADVIVELRGGPLGVSLDDDGAWLDGPAEYVFEGQVPERNAGQ